MTSVIGIESLAATRPRTATRERETEPAIAPQVGWGRRERMRRALNVAVAGTGLILAAPVMLIIAVLVKLTSPGPIIFVQARVGVDRRLRGQGGNRRRQVDLGGKPFTIFKFRTMRVADQQGDAAVWASPDDPRVTRLGRVLRKYRLDELPQLVNVLRGEMNVVGPRPEQPKIFREMREQLPDYPVRQRVPPGITGWAQVNYHYGTCIEDVRQKLEYDLQYVSRCSPKEDLHIMLRTLPVMLLKRGAW